MLTRSAQERPRPGRGGGQIVLNPDDGNAHDPKHWKNTLYYFLQNVFR